MQPNIIVAGQEKVVSAKVTKHHPLRGTVFVTITLNHKCMGENEVQTLGDSQFFFHGSCFMHCYLKKYHFSLPEKI